MLHVQMNGQNHHKKNNFNVYVLLHVDSLNIFLRANVRLSFSSLYKNVVKVWNIPMDYMFKFSCTIENSV